MRWSKSAVTDVMDELERSNTLSNGKDTPKATTRGNQLTRYTPRNLLKPITEKPPSQT